MGTDYTFTEEDKPAADPSAAGDVIELSPLTAGRHSGPADTEWAPEHHNF